MAIVAASVIMSNIIILLRISHFGMNPVSGGSPPIDRIVAISAVVISGDVVHMVPISFIVVDDVECSSINTGVVDRM